MLELSWPDPYTLTCQSDIAQIAQTLDCLSSVYFALQRYLGKLNLVLLNSKNEKCVNVVKDVNSNHIEKAKKHFERVPHG